jgi:tetratricopeptide (TPR) repeat protein
MLKPKLSSSLNRQSLRLCAFAVKFWAKLTRLNFMFQFSLLTLFFYLPMKTTKAQSEFYTPQNILKFADYLFQINEYQRAAAEYERFMFTANLQPDSIQFKIGLCYLGNTQYEKSLAVWQKLLASHQDTKYKPSVLLYTGYAKFRMAEHFDAIGLSHQALSQSDLTAEQQNQGRVLLAANHLTLHLFAEAQQSIAQLTNSDYKNGFIKLIGDAQKMQPKSPWLAGGLSAIIPGTGKFYANRPIDGLFTFFLLGFFSWQAYDGFSENHYQSTKGWIFTGLGSVFYLGNIYGSVIAVKIQNQEKNREFNDKISLEISKAFGY